MKKSNVQVSLESALKEAIEKREAVSARNRALPMDAHPDIREANMEEYRMYADRVRKLEDELDLIAPIYEVGDGITEVMYSDRHAYTVIEVSKSGKKLKIQRDNAEATNKEDLKFHIGGFAAHCSNQDALNYEYSRNPEGGIAEVSLRNQKRRDGSVKQIWVMKGSTTASGSGRVIEGRHEKYDYNF